MLRLFLASVVGVVFYSIPFSGYAQSEQAYKVKPQTWRTSKDRACCEQITAEFQTMVNEWIGSVSKAKWQALRAKFDSTQFYCPKYLPYKPQDPVKAGQEYDQFVASTKGLKDPWEKIKRTLRLVYETTREGDFHTDMDKTKLTAREKYIAYSTDQMSGLCSEYASFTVAVLSDLGISAGSFNFSTKDNAGKFFGLHTAVGVVLDDRMYLLDPMFCSYYVDRQSNPLSYTAIYTMIRQRRNSEIYQAALPHGNGKSIDDHKSCVTDTTAIRYRIDADHDRVEEPHDVEFADPLRFNAQKETILTASGYLLQYYSFFGFPAQGEGDATFMAKLNQILINIKSPKAN